MAPRPVHLRPTATVAERVLLPGDPGRALLLAQRLLDRPLMCNHNRGLWGYTGQAADGGPLTIQSTGMGGPSAAIVVEELAVLGARTLVRVGTCGALAGGPPIGALVVAREALCDDGASRALGEGPRAAADPALTGALIEAAGAGGVAATVVSTDLFYARDPGAGERDAARWRAAGALAVDMETATVLRLAPLRDMRAASLLLVSDRVGPPRVRIGDDDLVEGSARLGDAGARALARG